MKFFTLAVVPAGANEPVVSVHNEYDEAVESLRSAWDNDDRYADEEDDSFIDTLRSLGYGVVIDTQELNQTYRAWSLAVASASDPESPGASIHATEDDALQTLVDAYSLALPEGEVMTQSSVQDALEDRGHFTLERITIDTSDLEEL